MEFIISIFKPAKSFNLSEGHEKSWESNVLPENRKAKRQKLKKKLQTSNKQALISVEINTSTHFIPIMLESTSSKPLF